MTKKTISDDAIRTLMQDPVCLAMVSKLSHQVTTDNSDENILDLFDYALSVAQTAHRGQVRSSDQSPYLQHPLAVAQLTYAWCGNTCYTMAAMLHDAKEDSPVALPDLSLAINPGVGELVDVLTKDPTIEKKSAVEECHGRLLQYTAKVGPGAAYVKLADRAHNSVTSRHLSDAKLEKLISENEGLYAYLAKMLGAKELSRWFKSDPSEWWKLDGPMTQWAERMLRLQGPF